MCNRTNFEREIPLFIRCLPAWNSIVSLSQKLDEPGQACPPPTKQNFRLAFQVSLPGVMYVVHYPVRTEQASSSTCLL
jgi:hypothetical protein